MLNLHKVLLESERIQYERSVGAISSPNHFLQLLTNDPWFAWLHRLSLLIVAMDQALDSKRHPITATDAESFRTATRQLLVASEDGAGFAKRYFDALQRDPDVVMAHAKVMRHFAPPHSRN